MKLVTRYYVNSNESSDMIRWRHKFDIKNRKPLLENIQQFSGLIFTNVEYLDDDGSLRIQIIIRDTELDTIFFIEFALTTRVVSNEIKEIYTYLGENNNWILLLRMYDDYLHVVDLSGLVHLVSLHRYFRDDLIEFHPLLLTSLVKLDCFESDIQFNVNVADVEEIFV